MAWGVPTVLVIALLFIDRTNISTNEKRNPNFQYGNAQAAVSIFLLVMCFIGKIFNVPISDKQNILVIRKKFSIRSELVDLRRYQHN